MSGFSFQVAPKVLESALSKAAAVVATSNAPQGKNFMLEVEDKCLSVLAFSSDTFVRLRVTEAKAKGSGVFGFDVARLQGIIKNRSEMEFNYDGADCAFKVLKGKYEGKFVTLPLGHDFESLLANFTKKLKSDSGSNRLSRDTMEKIRDGLRLTAIKDVYADKPLVSYLDMSNNKLTVSTLDTNHFAHFTADVDSKKSFRIALPISHFNVIDKVAQDDKFAEFEACNTHLRIQSGAASMILPATQADEETFSLVPQFIKSMKKPTLAASYDHESLCTVIDNMFTLYTVNSKLQFSHKEGKPTISVAFSTQSGSASDSIGIKSRIDASFSENVDPRLFKDSLSVLKAQKKVVFAVIAGRALVFKSKISDTAEVVIVTSVSE